MRAFKGRAGVAGEKDSVTIHPIRATLAGTEGVVFELAGVTESPVFFRLELGEAIDLGQHLVRLKRGQPETWFDDTPQNLGGAIE
tara:strand:+ start:1225 stop:1479 length:255 start_codon:yes stop_codon:yes gene_type:complete